MADGNQMSGVPGGAYANPGQPYNPLLPVVPADAIAPEAKPGAKAGNPVLDDVLEAIRTAPKEDIPCTPPQPEK